MANPENKQIPYESTQKDIRDAIESVATAIGGITHPDAEDIVYDNSVSGLSATDVQNAIDELESEKADSSSLATVATSGDYDDLVNKPTIPTVNDATLTIQKNGSDVATFTANASSNVVANVTVPTTTSELTNNSDFVSDASYVHTDNNFTNAEKTKLGGIESGAEVNVQSDWNEADNTKDDYIKNKPDIDGLIDAKDGENISDDEPYIFRQGKGYLADEKIVGASVVWNQILFGDISDPNHFPITDLGGTGNESEGVHTLTLSITPTNPWDARMQFGALVSAMIVGHKYCSVAIVKASKNGKVRVYLGGATQLNIDHSLIANNFTLIANISSCTTNGAGAPSISCGSDTSNWESGDTISLKSYMLIDLTSALGTTIADYIYSLELNEAGAGVAFFRKYFPNDYYAYNSGSLQSVCIESKKVTGFNQWDEEWEVGDISAETGADTAENTTIRTKNYINVIPGETYYCLCPGSNTLRTRWYDADKNYIGYAPAITYNSVFTVPSNAHYLRFTPQATYGTTYNHDICINISDTSKNGTYEPYKSTSYPYDSSKQLRGLFNLDSNNNLVCDGDAYESNGSITRKYGIVDLGSVEWTYVSSIAQDGTTYWTFRYSNNDIKRYTGDAVQKSIISSNRYKSAETGRNMWEQHEDKTYCLGTEYHYPTGSGLVFIDDSYTDTTAFKTAMSGVYLLYELATPTYESADPYLNPSRSYPDGTEEFVDHLVTNGTRDVSIPVGHETTYYLNKVINPSADYTDAMTEFKVAISALGTNESGRTTASRAYTTGEFFYKDGKMYKVLTSIASGATFTVGTNISETTLFAELTALA